MGEHETFVRRGRTEGHGGGTGERVCIADEIELV